MYYENSEHNSLLWELTGVGMALDIVLRGHLKLATVGN